MDFKVRERLFSEIYDTYRHRIYRLCYAYIYQKEEVDDLFQEIMINIWNSLDRFRGDSNVSTWAYRVAINTAMLYNRKTRFFSKVKTQFSDSCLCDFQESTENKLEKERQLDRMAQCISQLEKQDRLIISLSLEGLSYNEISEIVGITPSHVGVKINRIKKQLFTLLGHGNDE